jgi:transmembrane sensor
MNYENYSPHELAADESFIRWVKGQGDQLFWDQWLLHHAEKKAVVEEARQLVLMIQFQQDPQAQQRVDALWERIKASNQVSVSLPAEASPRPWWRTWQQLAAVLVVGLLVTALWYFAVYDRHTIEYQTAAGETREIRLPDGSTVMLNANSSLSFRDDWEDDREVWLKGEAFFSVKKKPVVNTSPANAMAKFTVHTPWVHVQVLGTEFNVSERRRQTVVVLQSGKIQLNLPSENQHITMEPGDLVAFSDRERKLTRQEVNPAVYSAWTHQEWILDNLSLAEVAAKIEETYGLQVIIKNTENTGALVDGVVPTDNLDNLLKALSTAFEVKITRNKNQILIE